MFSRAGVEGTCSNTIRQETTEGKLPVTWLSVLDANGLCYVFASKPNSGSGSLSPSRETQT
jgi:hypothetical protein